MTLVEPPGETTHWTGRAIARAAGISHRSVQRSWAAHGLKPHRERSFKLSNDPKFAGKVQDVLGLYVDPPEHALVLSVDEKSQIQALDRTQPGLPLKQGRCGRHPRFHFHFTPTSTSWLYAVEGFFARLTRQCLKRGVLRGIVDLQAAINRDLAETNDNPRRFTWTADPDAIIEKVRRGKEALNAIGLAR